VPNLLSCVSGGDDGEVGVGYLSYWTHAVVRAWQVHRFPGDDVHTCVNQE
jgi:hypothetical protein